jgi:hypothetical protein
MSLVRVRAGGIWNGSPRSRSPELQFRRYGPRRTYRDVDHHHSSPGGPGGPGKKDRGIRFYFDGDGSGNKRDDDDDDDNDDGNGDDNDDDMRSSDEILLFVFLLGLSTAVLIAREILYELDPVQELQTLSSPVAPEIYDMAFFRMWFQVTVFQ